MCVSPRIWDFFDSTWCRDGWFDATEGFIFAWGATELLLSTGIQKQILPFMLPSWSFGRFLVECWCTPCLWSFVKGLKGWTAQKKSPLCLWFVRKREERPRWEYSSRSPPKEERDQNVNFVGSSPPHSLNPSAQSLVGTDTQPWWFLFDRSKPRLYSNPPNIWDCWQCWATFCLCFFLQGDPGQCEVRSVGSWRHGAGFRVASPVHRSAEHRRQCENTKPGVCSWILCRAQQFDERPNLIDVSFRTRRNSPFPNWSLWKEEGVGWTRVLPTWSPAGAAAGSGSGASSARNCSESSSLTRTVRVKQRRDWLRTERNLHQTWGYIFKTTPWICISTTEMRWNGGNPLC